MPTDNRPIRFQNTFSDAQGTVEIPADASAQWDMVRWDKSRSGVVLADRYGTVWIAGGDLAPDDTNKNLVHVGPIEGWALEEVNQEERVALRAVFNPSDATKRDFKVAEPTFFGFAIQRGDGAVVPYPITLPSDARNANYMEVADVANTVLPLGVAMANENGVDWGGLHDLRVRPGGIAYCDRNGSAEFERWVKPDTGDGWAIFRDIRLWLYVPAGGTFEVSAAIARMLPYDPRSDDHHRVHGFDNPQPPKDRGLQRKMAFYINGALSSSLDDASGVELVHGLGNTEHTPFDDKPQDSEGYPLFLRATFRSTVNAIHDISLAGFLPEGDEIQPWVYVLQPQLWARHVLPQPQFPLSADQ